MGYSPVQVEEEIELLIVNENPGFYEDLIEYFDWLGYDLVGEEWMLIEVDDELLDI